MTRLSVAAIFIVLAISSNSTFLFLSQPTDRPQLKANIFAEIADSSYPVALALEGDYSLASEFRLHFLDHHPNHEVFPERIVKGILRRDPEFDPYALALALEKLHCSTLILAPRELLQDIASHLEERGAGVRSTGDMVTGLWRVDPFDEHGNRVIEGLPLPPVTLPLSEELRESFWQYWEYGGERLRLSPDLEIARHFESEEPRYDEALNGEPMAMAGVTYDTGIGMQAEAEIEFAVPNGAVAFESIIGLNDDTHACKETRVVFELWDDSGHRIFASEPSGVGDPPQFIHIPLDATRTIKLLVTNAGEHGPCGHGNWAEPVLILSGC